MSKQKSSTKAADTGHTWDGNLRELTNQPPRWWMISLYLSMAWLVVYFILYPAFPLVSSATKGVMGWTQMKEYKEDLASIEETRAPFEKRLQNMSAAAILADDELSAYTVRSAKVLFGDRCAPCHGTGGAGNPGYPVLADDDWLYGGKIETIQQTITMGRQGAMPGFAGSLSSQEVDDLVKHTIALSKGSEHEAGKMLFMSKGCIGCHGMDAKGMQFMGSANLTDAIWRFVPGTEESVKHTILHGINNLADKESRLAVMPGFQSQLSETEIKKLAVYVHKLGGGQ
ncbi:MAG: cytochrome-c oxidase, cbb3-type subunit III [Gammaproteobacteria bacterium]|nr:cytochrome-c oxidase, cbb3-type subunit III [Gammaproteobacteria bacterium]